jgi:uncharacterized protein YaiI (UPF0178 family)
MSSVVVTRELPVTKETIKKNLEVIQRQEEGSVRLR